MSRATWWLSDDGPYGCCSQCLNRHTPDCDLCEDADLFELDEDAVIEEEERLAA